MSDLRQFIKTTIREFLNENDSQNGIIDIIFNQNPQLYKIGTKIDYMKYLNAIFPNSKVKKVMFHETKGDWYFNQNFSKEKIGKTDDGYYGRGFYFSTSQGLGTYGDKTIFVKLNIDNLKTDVNTHDIGKVILSSFDKNESKIKAIKWLDEQIHLYTDELKKLKDGLINKHKDIPKNINFEKYWSDEKNKRIVNYKKLLDKYNKDKENINELINYYYSFDAFSTDSNLDNYSEILVRDENRIHILGSNIDLLHFKKFMLT